MPIDETGLLAAMDTGIAEASGASPTPATQTSAPTTESTDASATTSNDAPTGDEPAGSEDNGEGQQAAEGDNGETDNATPDGSADGADGTATAPAVVDAKPADGADEATALAKLTPEQRLERAISDPLPNALKRETKERFQTVVTALKDKDHQLQRTNEDLNAMLEPIERSRATPAQYRQALDYIGLVNSGSIEDREKALQFMQNEMRALAASLGRTVPGINFLEGQNDLIQAISSGQISQEYAMQIAAQRAKDASARAVNQRAQADQTQRQTHEGERQRGLQELTAAGKEFQSDPQYKVKKDILVKSLAPIFQTSHPSTWAASFREAYKNLVLPAPAPAPTPAPRPAAPSNTPLRAANPAGGQQGAPKSSFDAVESALAQLRG